MADKNLHDIKIDELDSSKKTPLKNIITLIALLLVILAISVIITRLILNTDEGAKIENNASNSVMLTDKTETNQSTENTDNNSDEKKEAATNVKVPALSSHNVIERNLTSAIKTPLTAHTPKVMKTYTTPKKNDSKTEHKPVAKKPATTTKTNTTTKKNPTSSSKTHAPKKEYIDKVVAKKHTTKTTHKSSTKSASFLGGKEKKVTSSYYIKVGTYKDTSTVIRKIRKSNFNYSLVQVENAKELTRVLVGPFMSRNQAKSQLAKVKANVLTGAYITKTR